MAVTKTKSSKKTASKVTKAHEPVKAVVSKKETTEKSVGLVAAILGVDGKAAGHVTLPAELFGEKVNKAILAQAVRVYLANQRAGSASTKTRGEVEGSTRKIYKQKGTGKARHGGIRAPIFVGGGITFGPKPHDFKLAMSKSMRRVALASALSEKQQNQSVIVVDGFEALKPKTKLVAAALVATGATGSVLFAIPKDAANLTKATQNIANVHLMRAVDLHPYVVHTHAKFVITKQALDEMKKNFIH